MISGFNTDIEYNGTVYHVQTEDKGMQKRMILSLVYDKGTILASKRVNYNDLAGGGFDEKELAERVARQHKLICAAIRAGRINELRDMSKSNVERPGQKVGNSVTAIAPAPIAPGPKAAVAEVPARSVPPLNIGFVETQKVISVRPPEPVFEPMVQVVSVIEDEVLPAEAVEVVSELSGRDRPEHNKLSLELLGDTKFRGGDRRTVTIMICRGTARKVVAEAQILVKVLGSAFRPLIFHARSDVNGLAKVHLQLPHFQAGRAALLVRALSDGEEIEIRQIVVPG